MSGALKRIHRELTQLQRDPVPGCTAAPIGNDYFHWTGSIEGPPDTPYEGGVFNVQIILPPNYPLSAPQITFTTQIFHPNITPTGGICLDILNREWSAGLSIGQVLLSLQSLLADPNARDPYNGTAARLYLHNRPKFNKTARQWTQQHAYPPAGYVFTTTQTTTTTTPANNQDSAGTGSGGSDINKPQELIVGQNQWLTHNEDYNLKSMIAGTESPYEVLAIFVFKHRFQYLVLYRKVIGLTANTSQRLPLSMATKPHLDLLSHAFPNNPKNVIPADGQSGHKVIAVFNDYNSSFKLLLWLYADELEISINHKTSINYKTSTNHKSSTNHKTSINPKPSTNHKTSANHKPSTNPYNVN
ncbi:unnamed protein product [Medioppia subpectinata]|uniref:E2 ubiquitin-conjugating enzyme n=1 Tax=Medioppia subpectinata TaxID=1979941 RepID=A0A7R9KEQ4_9ACAR|nr:unnamed protein product [Medioppia subpectinata]CAG2101948.1 unnamed protein product [Medioppia subpectinata]